MGDRDLVPLLATMYTTYYVSDQDLVPLSATTCIVRSLQRYRRGWTAGGSFVRLAAV